MAKLKKKCIVILSIAFLVSIGFILPFYPVSGYPTYPQVGIIGMWTGSTPPTGWERVTLADGRLVMGTSTGESPGGTGGSSGHSHTYTQIPYHDHGYTSTYSEYHNHLYRGGGPTDALGIDGSDIQVINPSTSNIGGSPFSHTHSIYVEGYSSCQTESSSNLPPYQSVMFIEKISASAVFPTGLILISPDGLIPGGWHRCDGTDGTPDLLGDFLLGSASPNAVGGSATHNHRYTQVPYHGHSMAIDFRSHTHSAIHGTRYVKADDLSTVAYDAQVAVLSQTPTYHMYHSHSISTVGSSSCYTHTGSNLPPYTAVDFVMLMGEASYIPEGLVALWGEPAANIPYGWDVCDGTSGTLDLRNKFVRGRVAEAPGTSGGSTAHNHTYSTVPAHNHGLYSYTVDAPHSHQLYVYGSSAVGGAPLLGGGFAAYYGSADRWTSTEYYDHEHYVNPSGSSSPSTYSSTHYPPYVKLTYIQCNEYEADAPIFTSVPSDLVVEFGSYSGESFSWTATDSHPDTYSIDLLGAGMVVSPTNWGSGSPITYNIPDGYGVGTYTYEIELLDKYGRPNTDVVLFIVQDTTSPIITSTSSPLTVEYGYTGQSLSWTATDLNPSTYTVELIGFGIQYGPSAWSSGSPVIYNIPDGFGEETYTYNITFMDNLGNSDWSTTTFTVEDTTKPAFTDIPDDIVIEYGYSSLNISWTGSDPYPSTYTVERLGYGIEEGPLSWESDVESNFTIPLGLGVGTYTFTMNITDIFDNYQTDSMNFTVEDTTAPIIGTPASDLVVELGYTGQSFSWGVTDPYAENYTIELAGVGTVIEWTPWISGTDIVYEIPDGLDEGTYTYTLNVTDEFGNHANHVVTLTVEPDTTDPVITSIPDDITIEEGYSGQTLSWTTTDPFPATYTIELDGTGVVMDHTAWTSGGVVSYDIPNGFSAGTYTYTITFYDDYGNSIQDSVVFTVEEPPKPSVPGFGVPVILFITACMILTMILVLKKKTKIT